MRQVVYISIQVCSAAETARSAPMPLLSSLSHTQHQIPILKSCASQHSQSIAALLSSSTDILIPSTVSNTLAERRLSKHISTDSRGMPSSAQTHSSSSQALGVRGSSLQVAIAANFRSTRSNLASALAKSYSTVRSLQPILVISACRSSVLERNC